MQNKIYSKTLLKICVTIPLITREGKETFQRKHPARISSDAETTFFPSLNLDQNSIGTKERCYLWNNKEIIPRNVSAKSCTRSTETKNEFDVYNQERFSQERSTLKNSMMQTQENRSERKIFKKHRLKESVENTRKNTEKTISNLLGKVL